MKKIYKRKWSRWDQELLCVTHTDRPVELDQCNLNYLELRYSVQNRLPPIKPFETLSPAWEHSPYKGEVTIWEFQNNNFQKPRLLMNIRPKNFKPQFAIWYKQRLWILGVDVLEVYDVNLSRLAVIKDPWLSGGHTIVPDHLGYLLVSCSASDSVLVINDETYQVVQTLRMPKHIYGFNYSLARTDSVVEHYIINDYQLTHLNCAWPWHNGILVSTLIQGAIGWFDKNGNYQELLRGFVGCHGVRNNNDTGQMYFCDSCLGVVVLLTPSYTVDKRVDTGSAWLHDAHLLGNNIFALSVADRNQIEIMDFSTRKIISIIRCSDFGNSTKFIYFGK